MTDPIRPSRAPFQIDQSAVLSAASAFDALDQAKAIENANRRAAELATHESARASQQSAKTLTALLEGQVANEARERKMLFWTRVAGWGAIVGILIGTAALVVAIHNG